MRRVKCFEAYNAFKTIFQAQPAENFSCMCFVSVSEDLKTVAETRSVIRLLIIYAQDAGNSSKLTLLVNNINDENIS